MAEIAENKLELLEGAEANQHAIRRDLYLQGVWFAMSCAARGLTNDEAIVELEARHAAVLCSLTSDYLVRGIDVVYRDPTEQEGQ